MNTSEEFVYQICKKSFLSVWSYANPIGKKGKELCDILVVCEPDIIIFSVKDIQLTGSGDFSVDWQRWQKKAVEKSCSQIYGAERWLTQSTHVIRNDGSTGLSLPPKEQRRIHRVSVSLGGRDNVPLLSGNYGNGLVHVFDEVSSEKILQELDTISDFIAYLLAKEDSTTKTQFLIDCGGEEDLLAYYLCNGKQFPPSADFIVIEGGLWNNYVKDTHYKNKIAINKDSYVWDEIIEFIGRDILNNAFEYGSSLGKAELAIRTMAREDRFSRRVLGSQFIDFITHGGYRSRVVESPSGIFYVYLLVHDVENREHVTAELAARCFVVRGLVKKSTVVIGLVYELGIHKRGYAISLFYLHKSEWTEDDQKELELIQNRFEFFADSTPKTVHEDEYPSE